MKYFITTMIVATALLVVLSKTSVAYPSSSPLESTCTVEIDTSTQGEMLGRYEGDNWEVSFRISLDEDTINSFTTFRNTSDESFEIQTQLSFPNTEERQIPGMTKHIVDAALQLTQETDCSIPENISKLYQEFADALYKCVVDMGPSQFHFSVMYHGSILGSANRYCAGIETVCTPSPKYELGNELFICSEDLQELFPVEAREGKQKMQAIRNQVESKAPREKRIPGGWFPGCSLQGSDWCCCGNYGGCCSYAHVGCCIHDAACTCCGHWLCGWQCQPDSWC